MYKEKIVNGTTGEVTWRDYTTEEIEQVKAAIKAAEQEKAENNAKAALRNSALAKLIDLGLTEDEIAAL